ncbi:DUF4202 domain-containing protein [Phaeobacter gallaeciensis]|uniref:DUF4202 domain-containing protein n=2 Tax=Roseobacteraceae TaxID=2854170 RepID=A0A366X548_9RHOB|nr:MULTISPECIES: DUF4202 domain-containing protein [Roseobacteraceae]MBT3142498.1 DUF4202 domain-containing protein [Falsiruegeria litorea]MBT8169274.1 DUF4202 domain-containing protein [Falsiruegeria litorea]RBW60511.1 DUF4202 domain-containing protein [Phaeobacter gallaeciensis]
MTPQLDTVLNAIDAANAADPRQDEGQPEALLYGHRMSAELDRLFPEADDLLRIAARGQHVERWTLARSEFPDGRTGYLTWRKALAVHHADIVTAMMQSAGYSDADRDAVGGMLRKEGIKRDPQVQALEDVICFVFLKWYFAPFAAKHSPEKIQRIVEKTARKMSAKERARVLDEFDLPEDLANAFKV